MLGSSSTTSTTGATRVRGTSAGTVEFGMGCPTLFVTSRCRGCRLSLSHTSQKTLCWHPELAFRKAVDHMLKQYLGLVQLLLHQVNLAQEHHRFRVQACAAVVA